MAGRPYLMMPCRSCRRFMLLTSVSLCLIATALTLASVECLNRFSQAFGCMPLVDEVARIEYGFKHNAWYKSLADKLWAQLRMI